MASLCVFAVRFRVICRVEVLGPGFKAYSLGLMVAIQGIWASRPRQAGPCKSTFKFWAQIVHTRALGSWV